MPTFAPNGYQQLGSPNNTASDFSTSVTQIADSLTWLKGRHTLKMGLDWRWERLNVVQPPSPTGSFAFSTVGSDLPGVADTGNAFASFLLGQVQTFAIDLQQTDIQERAHFQEYFIQDDWKVSDRLTINRGAAIHAELPVDGDQRSNRGVQSYRRVSSNIQARSRCGRSRRTTSVPALAPCIA